MADGYPIKLVRDRVASVDTSEGITYRPVRDQEEHVKYLRIKLAEEVGEYLVDPGLDELVDLYTTLQALAYVDLGVRWGEVVEATLRKAEQRGGFERGTVMVTVEP